MVKPTKKALKGGGYRMTLHERSHKTVKYWVDVYTNKEDYEVEHDEHLA